MLSQGVVVVVDSASFSVSLAQIADAEVKEMAQLTANSIGFTIAIFSS